MSLILPVSVFMHKTENKTTCRILSANPGQL